MKYEKAKAEVVLFDNSDVITASRPEDFTCTGPGHKGLEHCGDGHWGNQ